MPFTPYHFGPSAALSYPFRKWLDLPVFILANIAIDFEVFIIGAMHLGRPMHRYCHTLLIGSAVGFIFGILFYFATLLLLRVIKRIFKNFKSSYRPHIIKMAISGALGACFHVFIDSIYHYDVFLLWPSKKHCLWNIISQKQVKQLCLLCFAVFLLMVLITLVKRRFAALRCRRLQAED